MKTLPDAQLLGHKEVVALIEKMANDLRTLIQQRDIAHPVMIGIRTGGAWVAQLLHQMLEIEEPLGVLDISFYRDDLAHHGMHPRVLPSTIPFQVDDRHIVLVDDVLQTGRTIRAALNEIFDFGRPASVTLATLVERDGRELPIEASVIGLHVEAWAEPVTLTGPVPLNLILGQDKRQARADHAG